MRGRRHFGEKKIIPEIQRIPVYAGFSRTAAQVHKDIHRGSEKLENSVEIAAKGRDFEQILRLRRKACLTDRRQSKLRLFHQVHHS